jgi:Ca-activated chloride channel family protein
MRIAAPQMFWLLVVMVLPLIGFLWWAWRRRQVLIAQFISPRLLGQLKVGVSPSRQKARLTFIVLAVIFIIVALARPQWGRTQEEVRQRGLDIIVAIDTSKSMLAEDVPPNRLARAKLAALDLVRRAKTDRLGLVAFAGAAFLQCPLTLDDAAFSQSVDSLDTRAISQGGTAIAEAIDEARKAFKKDAENHKVLVLFTDGEDQDSEAVTAAERAAKEGMIIFTVGIGTPEGELLRIRDERGRIDYIRDEQGNPVRSRLNEDLLQKIARATKGFYLPLRGGKTMDTLYEQGIAPLPKSEGTVKLFQRYTERYQWPLAAAIALLIIEMFLPDRSRRRSARPAAVPPVIGAATGTVAVLLLFLALPLTARAGGPGGALREYNEGKFLDALKDYNELLEKKNDDPRLHFNAGAAAYQGRQLDEAARQFNQALASPDLLLQQRAYYNLGNTLYRLGQQVSDAAKKQEAWENSLKQYDSALKLNQQDADARFNQDYVKKQLEELKKQQQQQQNQKNQDQKDSKDQDKNQQSQNQKNEKNQQDKQDQKNQQNQKDQQQNQAEQNKSGQDQKNSDQSEAKDKDQQKDQDKKPDQSAQNPAGGEPKDQSSEEARREAELMAAGQMTQQQARQLLDSQKDDEQVLRLAPPNKNTSQARPFKDW